MEHGAGRSAERIDPGGQITRSGAKEPWFARPCGVRQRLERHLRGGEQARRRVVDGPATCGCGAAEVADELVVGDRHLDPHLERAVAEAVVVDVVVGVELALRQLRQLEPGDRLAVLDERVDRLQHRVDAVLGADLAERALADPHRRRLRHQVADGLARRCARSTAIMSTSASLRSPRFQILTQGNCSPSW